MGMKEVDGLISLLGLLGAVAISVWQWKRDAYKLIPFVYATIVAIVWSWSWQKSWLESLEIVAAMNAIAGGLLLAAWFELRQK